MTRDKQKAKHKRLAERERLETKKREVCLDALMSKPKVEKRYIYLGGIKYDEDDFRKFAGNLNPGVNTQWFIDQLRKF